MNLVSESFDNNDSAVMLGSTNLVLFRVKSYSFSILTTFSEGFDSSSVK